MKKTVLVPVAMVFLMAISWFMLIKDASQGENLYNDYLAKARMYAEDGITKYAIENYNLALEVKNDPEVHVEVAQYYKTQGELGNYQDWCEDFLELFPQDVRAFDCMLDSYMVEQDYEGCFDVLEVAKKRNITSEYMEQISAQIAYAYELAYSRYDDVGVFSSNFCAVQKDGFWGFVNRYGVSRVSCSYAQVGTFTQAGCASVQDKQGNVYFVDSTEAKVLVAGEKYQMLGLLSSNRVAAQKEDGTYTYLNENLEPAFGQYDYASTINGIGAVKAGDRWQLIDGAGNPVSDSTYLDVKLDGKQIAYRNERAFVSTVNGTYIMVDGTGTQIGLQSYEDARVFAGNEPTAVRVAGRWCFIDANGNRISEKTYDDARSFANGLAAVCVNGKWGFVEMEENIVIEPEFADARDFNEKGSCFVKVAEQWQLLKLYRLNRE